MTDIDLELLSVDATEQRRRLQSGECSAGELQSQIKLAINILDPKINAFIAADEQLGQLSVLGNGPLSGLVIGAKDNIDVMGFNTTAGLETRRNSRAEQDAHVIERLRMAGGVFAGKLNMHEGALGASNHNSHYGDCFNPHQFDLTPGGSSGGSAAAVSAGLVSFSLGTDTMGSVRIPASYCGVFGLKPSRGAVSNRGSVTCSRLMDNIGPLARSARDLAMAFECMAGFDPANAESQLITFNQQSPTVPKLLIPDDLTGLNVDEDIIDDFERNLFVFESMGCELQSFSFDDYDFGAARRAGLIICEADMRVEHAHDWQNNQALFSDYLRGLLSYIDRKSPMDLVASERVLDRAVVKARQLFSQGHFLLLPTAPQRAFPMTAAVPANQADLTSFANQAGLAALSMPMLTDHALPAGMQLVGPWGWDEQLLSMACAWQQASGFTYQLPSRIKQLLEDA